jgi:hypothetical protein
MMEWASKRDEAAHVEKAAEDPRPAPIGRLADAVNVTPGLIVSSSVSYQVRKAYEF